ncbi:MAG: hypothetical protein U1E65_24930 [Myxococcota bacterium]
MKKLGLVGPGSAQPLIVEQAQTSGAPLVTPVVNAEAPTKPAEAARLGVLRYGGPIHSAADVHPMPSTAEAAAQQVQELAALAVRYAKAGKPRIAKQVMGEAKAVLENLGKDTKGALLLPGQYGGGAAFRGASEAVERADLDLVRAAKVKAVAEGKAEKTKTVLLFGTSGNPPTGREGHAGIVEWGAKTLRVDMPDDKEPKNAREQVAMDEVWVLPVYKHAFASKSNLLPFEHRFSMAKIGFENLPGLEGRVQVKDTERVVIEAAMAKAKAEGKKAGLSEEESVKQMRVGTIDIVRHLMAEHPDTQFVLALGGDTYLDLLGGKWKEGDTLQQLLPIVALPRAGVTSKATAENGPKLSDISSTKVRESHDLEFLASVLHPDVLKYILDHKLYAFSQPEG